MKLENKIMQTTLEVEGKEFTVFNTVGTYKKQAIIESALQSCFDQKGRMHRTLFDAALYALIVMEYTDIDFEGMEETNIIDLFDIFSQNGIVSNVVNAVNSMGKDIETLLLYADVSYDELKEQLNSAASAVNALVTGILQTGAIGAATQAVINEE